MQYWAVVVTLTCLTLGMAEPPVNQYLPPNQGYQTPSSSYGPPQRGSGGGGGSGGSGGGGGRQPSTNYGAPAVTSAIFPKQGGRGGQGQGGRPANGGYGGAGGANDEGSYGPAKYEFKYDVQDFESGNDFGHMESRDGDVTVGRYYVLLPDGRKQIVDYEADFNGYRPMVRYEDVGGGRGGGGGGGNGGTGGGGGGGGGYDSNAQQIKGGFGGYQ